MSENNTKNCFKEAVCIETMRVFDSCSAQDCLEDLQVSFSAAEQALIDNASHVKSRCVEVADVSFAIDTVPFNKGFYSVDITYTFKVDLEVFSCGCEMPSIISGTARFSKKVILFGSEGNTKQFTSEDINVPALKGCCNASTLPRAAVSVVDPIVLDLKLVCRPCPPMPPCGCDIPCNDGEGCHSKPPMPMPQKAVKITIGLFSIVKLERPVSVLVPIYDYCIPMKECSNSTDSPCELFEKINFPISEFFPKGLEESLCDTKRSENENASSDDADE